MKQFTTNPAKNLHWQETAVAAEGMDFVHIVNVFPERQYQQFDGFGGAFTEAAGYALAQLPQAAQQEVIDAYFAPDGLRYNLGRIHLNSCDFALGNYAAMEDPGDTALASFSIARDEEYLLPMVRRAIEASPAPLALFASPWSPPAFMKTNGEMNNGGALKPEYYGLWAKYLAKYIQVYRAAGIPVTMLSIQNEPEATQTWDSCRYTAEEEGRFAAEYLAPALAEAGLSDIKVFAWDHNKDMLYQRMEDTLAVPGANAALSGFAFHWYTGDHFEAVALAREVWPEKTLYFTEGCVEYSRFSGANAVKKAEMYAHDILGNLSAGCNGSIDWNLLLDAKGGPNHVHNYCDAPIMTDAEAKGIVRQLSYYYIGQFSRHIKPGARRIATTSYASQVECVAFANPDGERVICLLNRTDEALPICLREGLALKGNTLLEAHSIITLVY